MPVLQSSERLEELSEEPVVAYDMPEPECITEPVMHMWTPLHLRLRKDYEFVPTRPSFRVASFLLRGLAHMVLPLINRFVFGLRVKGRRNLNGVTGGAVTICNHVHMLDCGMVACTYVGRRLFFPTLKSNLEIPVIRHIVRLLGGFPIPDTASAMIAFSRTVKELLRDGNIVHLYPEGVLVPYYDGVRAFRKGAFTLAYDCQVPVVPFLISYREPRGLHRLLRRKPLLTLQVLPPVLPEQEGTRRESIDRLRRTCLSIMTQAYREQSRRDA